MADGVRVGMVGLGVAARQVLSSIEATPGARLTAVCDIRADEMQRFKERFGIEPFSTVEDLCAHGPVDAIWVATPNRFHAEHTVTAADHGKHVICEKPMAISLDEAHRMVDAVERNGVKYIQGHSRIHRPYVRKMGDIIASGRLGRVININTWMYNDWMRRPWEFHSVDPTGGGGVVYRQAPHQLDVVRYLAGGMVRSVRAAVGKHSTAYQVPGDYHAYVDFEDGACALVSFNGYGHFDVCELTWGIGEGGRPHTEQQLYGPRRRATGPIPASEFYALDEYSLETWEKRDRQPRKQDFFGLLVVSCEQGDIRQSPDGLYVYTEQGREEVLMTEQELRAGEIRALVDALTGSEPAFPDVRWGRATLEVVIGMIESSERRSEVRMQYQVPSPVRQPAPA